MHKNPSTATIATGATWSAKSIENAPIFYVRSLHDGSLLFIFPYEYLIGYLRGFMLLNPSLGPRNNYEFDRYD